MIIYIIESWENMLKEFLHKLENKISLKIMIKIICALLILFLLIQTEVAWGSWLYLLRIILRPFLYGFLIAYIMNPIIEFLKSKGINKNISVFLLWFIMVVLIIVIIVMLMPILYEKINEFIISLINGVQWMSDKIKTIGKLEDFSLVNSMTNSIIDVLQSYDDWMPVLVSNVPYWMNSVLNYVTNFLFTIIIAIYIQFDFDRIKKCIKKLCGCVITYSDHYLHEIDENVTVYLKSMVLLIFIRFIEYCMFYYCVGHPDWLIIGLLSSIGTIIPYIGGTIANVIGLFTGLTLPMSNVIAMIIGILILSNVDNYVISPIVHKKRSAIGPLLSIFAVFAGGVLCGFIGVILSMPIVIAVKTCIQLYRRENSGQNLSKNTNDLYG